MESSKINRKQKQDIQSLKVLLKQDIGEYFFKEVHSMESVLLDIIWEITPTGGKRSNHKYSCPYCKSFIQDDNSSPKIISQTLWSKKFSIDCPYCRKEMNTKKPTILTT